MFATWRRLAKSGMSLVALARVVKGAKRKQIGSASKRIDSASMACTFPGSKKGNCMLNWYPWLVVGVQWLGSCGKC